MTGLGDVRVEKDKLYQLPEVRFTLTGVETVILLDLVRLEAAKSNLLGNSVLIFIRDKLLAQAAEATKDASA